MKTFTGPDSLDLFNLSTVFDVCDVGRGNLAIIKLLALKKSTFFAIYILQDVLLYVFGRWWAGHNLNSAMTSRAELSSRFRALLAPRRAPTPAGRQKWGLAMAGGPFVVIGVHVPNNRGCLPDGYPSCMTQGDAGSAPGITLGFKAQLRNNGLHGIKQAGQLKILYLILTQELCVILLLILLSTALLQPLSLKHL
jgi:hypothetical protein